MRLINTLTSLGKNNPILGLEATTTYCLKESSADKIGVAVGGWTPVLQVATARFGG